MKDQEVFEALLSNARSVTLPGRITYFLIYTNNSKVGIRRQKTNSPLLLDNVFILEYFYIFHVIILFCLWNVGRMIPSISLNHWNKWWEIPIFMRRKKKSLVVSEFEPSTILLLSLTNLTIDQSSQ